MVMHFAQVLCNSYGNKFAIIAHTLISKVQPICSLFCAYFGYSKNDRKRVIAENLLKKTFQRKWGHLAAVSCSPNTPRLGGVGFVIWLTGKPRRAWHRCMGVWELEVSVTSCGGAAIGGSLKWQPTNPTPPNLGVFGLHDTAVI